MVKTLKEKLESPTDWDGAEHELATVLGLVEEGSWFKHKGLYWTNNPTGNMLHDILKLLVSRGILILNEDEQYQWNSQYTNP